MNICGWTVVKETITTECNCKIQLKKLLKFVKNGVPYCPFCGKRVKVVGFKVTKLSHKD